jgi:cation transport protein ChaC
MVSGSYDPRWVTVQIEGVRGARKALCFLMNRAHERYAGRLSDAAVADAIAKAAGPLGACRDYLDHTVSALEALGIKDKPLARMQKMVEERIAAAAAR